MLNELQVVVDQVPGSIRFNFDELKTALAEKMELYKSATFTEEYKAMARSEVATLRKMKKAIDDKRKSVKMQCLVPYKEFEEKAEELMALIEEPIQLINHQIEEMESKRKAERKAKIQEFYDAIIGDLVEYLPLHKIYNSKWENASTTITTVKKELEQMISSTRTAILTLQSMTSDVVPQALERYKNSLDLADAIAYINQYEVQRLEIIRREEEHRRQLDEERIRKQERERIVEEERIRKEEREKTERELCKEAVQEAAQGFFAEDDDLPFEQQHTITAFYKVVATPEELEQVEMAFDSIGIFFERRDAK